MQWSQYQQDIFKAISQDSQSLIIEAVAGSGKTTTIVEGISHVPSEKSVAFLAFNKAIAETLRRRISAPNAKCMTLHAAGLVAWKQFLSFDAGLLSVDSRKMSTIVKDLREELDKPWGFAPGTLKLVGLAKGAGIVPGLQDSRFAQSNQYHGLVEDDDVVWEDLISFYDLDPDECSIDFARVALMKSIEQAREVVDFDDMLYMPIITAAPFEKFDVVFLDEAQDVSPIQIEMVERMVEPRFKLQQGDTALYESRSNEVSVDPGGRVIAVGDSHQAIYGFRGALSDSMEQIADRFHCRALPLSVCYRCPRSVVRRAQRWVSHIEWHGDAEEGLTVTANEWNVKDFQPGVDAVLCRVARPLVDLAFKLIRNKVPAMVLGRDIGAGLVKLIDKMKAIDLEDLEKNLVQFREREVRRAKGDMAKVAQLDDKLDTLGVFIHELSPDEGIADLRRNIEGLFGDSAGGQVTLSTVHKAKGLEFDRVFILDADLYMPSRWAKQHWQRQQEANLCYVAATRAKRELRYISSDTIKDFRVEQVKADASAN